MHSADQSGASPLRERRSTRPAGEIRTEKGSKLAPLGERLQKLGLVSDWDFVLHLPMRYEDETAIVPIRDLRPQETAQVEAVVRRTDEPAVGNGRHFVADLTDGTGWVSVRFIHYFSNVKKMLAPGNTVVLFGEVRENSFLGRLEFVHPKIKPPVDGKHPLPPTLTPVYSLGEGIQQSWLRKRIDRAMLDLELTDLVPRSLTERLGLPGFQDSLKYLHHPPAGASFEALRDRTDPHWMRLKFDELLAQQVLLRTMREMVKRRRAPSLTARPGAPDLCTDFRSRLPFGLTGAQERVLGEIFADLGRERPMNRLLQGDVGSGKTVVAALAALRAVEAGTQAALMAPTSILAEQHFRKIVGWLEPLGIRTAWLTGKLRTAERREALEAIRTGAAQVVVGTHALIQESVCFMRLGLVIIDEQHRFGVRQRLALRTTGGADSPDKAEASGPAEMPHLLMLSATPIPRTLAMSYLSDLDVSVIDELPPGRTPVTTKIVRIERREEVKGFVSRTVLEGRQVYWVCPLIEESETLDITPAVEAARDLGATLPDVRVGLIHSALPQDEKTAVMERFCAGEIDLLVATTVIEVGVDVPNATLMVIEHAERFGLAQLHQLRGRVGRGGAQSGCILLYGAELSATGRERLRVIRETTDGFEIARRDLEIRGPGEFLGAQQSGMPLLRFANLETDAPLLEAARRAAEAWVEEDPGTAREHARRWFRDRDDFLSA